MEACMMKPEVKKKPKPPKPPPKPTEVKRNEAEGDVRPAPLMPPRPTDTELTHTQYRMKRPAASSNEQNGSIQQQHTKIKPSKAPVAPPRLTEKEAKAAARDERPRKTSGDADQPEAAADDMDFKRSNQSGLTGMLRRSQKEKMPTFTSYMTDVFDKEEKSDEVKIKQAPSNKPSYMTDVFDKEEKSDEVKIKQAPSNKPEKGGFFSGILKKSNKPSDETSTQEKLSDHMELSASSDSLSDNNKEKGGIFSGIFRKSPKPAETDQDQQSLSGDLSGSNDNLTEVQSKDKGFFNGILRKSPKIPGEGKHEQDKEDQQSELSTSNKNLSENTNVKEKGGIFGGMFKKTPKSSGVAQSEEDAVSDTDVSASNENLSDNKQERSGGLFSGLLKKTPKAEKTETSEGETQRELSASTEHLVENNKDMDTESQLSGSIENLANTTGPKEKKGGLAGIFKTSSSFENLLDEEKINFNSMFNRSSKPAEEESPATGNDATLFGSSEDLLEANATKEKSGGLAWLFKKSPKPSPRSVVTQDPLTKQLSASLDSLTEAGKDDGSSWCELSASTENLCETSSNTKEKKGGFSGMFKRTPKNLEQQEGEDTPPPTGRGLSRKRTIKQKRRVVSFRVKKTLPKVSKENSNKMPLIEESVEMEELNAPQENTVLMEPVEMAAYPSEENPTQMEQENNELMEWWNSVKGWTEWNESSNFQEEDEQMAMEQAADRVYMAARVFVHLFNQRGASLQHRILELISVADAADEFHKKTVSAAVGGGVASVAGSVATITGLILAPFTFGASIIVTAVGIGVATAGSITSATANITDTVHSNMDRKKVEKMIQGYQEEIQDIRKCMEFVQEGMNTLEEWDFEKYSESAAKKALNHNIKHVMKEGGRAGKALMINTDKLISTVQVLGAAGGAAKAAQAISVTTGVMSALFLALDVFFLAKDSHELRKGAKTKFAGKIRQVCKDLQDGLLELNKVKTQLQKTMDGIEVEEYEEIEEVEVEVEDEFESDPKKLAELEQEIDFLEEKLDKKEDKKEDVEPNKSKETALDIFKIKKEKKEENSMKEKQVQEKEEKDEGEKKKVIETSVKTVKEALKEQFDKVSKKEKETENQMTSGKEKKAEKKQEKSDEPNQISENKKKGEKEQKEKSIRSGDPEKDKRLTPHGVEGEKSQKKTEMSEPGGGSSRRRQSRSEKDGEKHETRERKEERGRGESWRRRGKEERGAKDWRAEMVKNREEKRERKEMEREDPSRRKDSHRSHRGGESPRESKTIQHARENEERQERGDDKRSSRVESARKRFERAAGDQQEEEEEGRQRRKEERESQRTKEERESQRRRGSDREHGHSWKGSRSKYEALRHNGLNI